MSVDFTYNIGDPIPAGVDVLLEQLGGDGFTSPGSHYDVSLNVLGDASGGDMVVRVRPDPQFLTLCAAVRGYHDGPSPLEGRFSIVNMLAYYDIWQVSIDGGGTYTDQKSWFPHGSLLETIPGSSQLPAVSLTLPNTSGVREYMSVRFYNFNKLAKERVPLEQIFACLGRPSSYAE